MHFPLLTSTHSDEFELRLAKVRSQMHSQGIDAMLVASTVNIFYLTGGVCRGYFYLPLDAEPVFFILPPAEAVADLQVTIHKPENIPAELQRRGLPHPAVVGLEFSDLYYSEVERLKKLFPGSKISDGSAVMRAARLIKTDYEIDKMRENGRKHCAVYSRIDKCYHRGMTDLEFQIEIERVLRREGCLGYLRVAGSAMEINMGSVLAGKNADEASPYDFSMGGAGTDPSLPVGASGLIMERGMAVMVDMNGGFNGYQTDMTRCYSIGAVSPEARKAHSCSIAILRDLEQFSVPGIEIGEMYRRAERMAHEAGLGDYFMGHRRKAKFIGHGIGIELNEAPVVMERNKRSLEKGMTLALEPKFVIPGVGAVGVENTYVVGDNGLVNLTPLGEKMPDLDP